MDEQVIKKITELVMQELQGVEVGKKPGKHSLTSAEIMEWNSISKQLWNKSEIPQGGTVLSKGELDEWNSITETFPFNRRTETNDRVKLYK